MSDVVYGFTESQKSKALFHTSKNTQHFWRFFSSFKFFCYLKILFLLKLAWIREDHQYKCVPQTNWFRKSQQNRKFRFKIRKAAIYDMWGGFCVSFYLNYVTFYTSKYVRWARQFECNFFYKINKNLILFINKKKTYFTEWCKKTADSQKRNRWSSWKSRAWWNRPNRSFMLCGARHWRRLWFKI